MFHQPDSSPLAIDGLSANDPRSNWLTGFCLHRSFLNRAYPTMKKHNPHTPILMREASGTEPRVFARYGTPTLDSHRVKSSIRKFDREKLINLIH